MPDELMSSCSVGAQYKEVVALQLQAGAQLYSADSALLTDKPRVVFQIVRCVKFRAFKGARAIQFFSR
jgi:hypothetical protein